MALCAMVDTSIDGIGEVDANLLCSFCQYIQSPGFVSGLE